jgi:hypothetical protein
MQVEFDLPMTALDTPAVKNAFEFYIAKCKAEIAAGNRDYYVGYQSRLEELLRALETAEGDAFRQATRRR